MRALHDFFANGRSAERKVHITRLAGACTETAGLHVKSAECTIPSMGNAPLLQRDVSSYVEKELIQYCLGSLERAIPRAHDGLNVQRKIMAWWLEHNQFGRTNSKRKAINWLVQSRKSSTTIMDLRALVPQSNGWP